MRQHLARLGNLLAWTSLTLFSSLDGCASRPTDWCKVSREAAAREANWTTRQRPMAPAAQEEAGALVILVGGARTILCTFPKIVKYFLEPLDPSKGGADLFAFLKYTDPGPKGQEHYDFEYPDVDP
mmetsp:Transcript_36510/g.81899  ORF Transcript_36510/g.81899 Transcript_36510/m.81899 type:complete len:126 (+) Transcript_36510:232-609(+)|eukprot:CAMPEP_0172615326 /NCGR_PEP_ID=MMETSP1068-20121228/57840_1 /TAXON_ID=35684 /ORGANISM="Pseudopedinella elastica, Strain CCMP716" /LENGTH=125 /DNA_ID=CAMNT_0013420429 /DNA_START=219 /DNA_END=596 /DNA_ORIENTATION=+